MEGLLAQGVKESDLQAWTRVVDKAGVKPEALTAKLEEYGSLERLCSERRALANTLGESIRRAKAALAALNREQGKVQAAIASTRDGALTEMAHVGNQARHHLDLLLARAKEHGELERQAAMLKVRLTIARAFSTMDGDRWVKLTRPVVQDVMAGLLIWARHETRNLQVPLPDTVRSNSGVPSWCKMPLSDLMLWALTGVAALQEQKAMAARG